MTIPAIVAPAPQGDAPRLPFNQEDFLKDIDARVARLITKNKGDPEEALGLLMNENKKYRDQNDALTRLNAQLTQVQPSKEDLVLKTAEDRALFKAAQDLLTAKVIAKPEDLPTLVAQRDDLLKKDTERAESELITELAGDEYDDVGLKSVMEIHGMAGELKTITVRDPKDPKKTLQEKIPHVKKRNDEKAVAQPLKEWLDATLNKTTLAIIRKDGVAKNDSSDTRDGRRRVASFPDQSSVATITKGKANEAGSNTEAVGKYLSSTFTLPDHLTKKKE